jgi:hypothetical protein
MTAVPFGTSSGKALYAESGGRLINAYAEKLVDGRVVRRRAPGIDEIAEIVGFSRCRGAIEINGVLLAAVTDRLVTITRLGDSFTLSDIGSFPGTTPVYFARNNKSPTPDIVAVSNASAFVIDLTTGASAYPDSDVGSPNSVTFQGGYFVFSYGNARMRCTGLNTTDINTLDTAFAESKPDGLYRVIGLGRNVYAFGPYTVEIWVNSGNATGFPFSYLDTIPRGLAGPDAVAGHENGWSSTLIFVGDDGVVYRLSGDGISPVSNASVAGDIEALADRSTLTACVYVDRGHAIWALSCDDWTWCYDLSTGEWFERASHGRKRWRAAATVKCFDRWIVGDEYTGKFGFISSGEHFEFDDPLTATVISATMSGFPSRAILSRLMLDIMAGTGEAVGIEPGGINPQCSISFSKDGGVTFGSPVLREMGRQGKYKRVVSVNRVGLVSTKGFQARVDVSDPVDFSLFGGDVQVAQA